MRIVVIHPGASFSTHDVHMGVVWGLRANGAEVIEYRLDKALQISGALIHAAVAADALESPVDVFGLASAEAVGTIVHYEPDAVLVVSGGNFPLMRVAGLARLSQQRRVPFPIALYDTEAPYVTPGMAKAARQYTTLFTNERSAVARYEHPDAHYLAHAYHPHTHTPGPAEADLATQALFIGTAFPERRALFDAAVALGAPITRHGILWDEMEGHAGQTISPEGTIDNADAVRWYRSTQIAINHHRTSRVYGSNEHIDASEAQSLGPRAYELAAVGAFQLCDNSRAELIDLFGDTVPTYQAGDADSLARQVAYWLDQPERRRDVAAAARERVQPHRWDTRAAFVLEVLEAARDDLKSRHRRRRKRVPVQPPGTFVNLSKPTKEPPDGNQARSSRGPVLGGEHRHPSRGDA